MVQHLAITDESGFLHAGQIVVTEEQPATDEAISAFIVKAGIKAAKWRRISLDDLPQSRADRDAWADDGRAIGVDPVRKAAIDAARAARRNPLAEVDALNARIDAMTAVKTTTSPTGTKT